METENTIDDDLEIMEKIRLMDLFPSIVSGRAHVLCDDRYVSFTNEDKDLFKKVILESFSGRPIGSALTLKNDNGETLEIIKKGRRLFDTIEHLEDGQNKVFNICPDLAISILFRGGYEPDTMIETDQPMEDSAPVTCIKFKRIPLKGQYRDVEYRYIVTFPDGTTETDQKILEARY